MYTEGLEYWTKLNQNLTGPFAEINKATAQLIQKTYQQQIEMTSENIAKLSTQVKRLSNINKPEEIINLQKECINENITTAVDNLQKIMQITMQNFETLTKSCSSCGSTRNAEQNKTVSKTGK